MPTHPVALRIGQVMATLSRPVGDGAITFSLRRPTATGALYSCTPVHGRCAMAWSAHNAGAVAIAAHWSGDRHYRSADATLTITVSRAVYSDSGTWQGQRVGPLTRVAPAVDVPRLPGAARAGYLTRFHSDDPAYRCLDGKSLAVYTAPHAYPDDYVAYSKGRGSGCAAGTWLYPKEAGVSTRHALSGEAGRDIVVPGSFPASRPAGAVAQLYDHGGSLVATASAPAWSSRAVTARVPASLAAGAYTLRVSWYDRLTGTAVRSDALTIHISAPRHSAPAPTGGPNPSATDIPVAPGPPVLPAVPTTRPRPASTSTAIPTTAANPPPAPPATSVPAPPPPATSVPAPPPPATSAPAPPPATSAPAPASTSIPAVPATAVPTDTPTPTSTATATPPPTLTVVPSPTATPRPTITETSTALPTATTTPTPTATATMTPLPPTSTRVPSSTPTTTATPNPVATSTATAPALPSSTPILTPTGPAPTGTTAPPSPTSTATATSSPTTSPTATPTGTATPSPSSTPTASPTSTATATA